MFKKPITYTDFNGVERTESFYFNLTKAEIAEMDLTTEGGLEALLQRVVDAKDTPTLAKLFKRLILKSYGIKSDDGKRFIKSDKIAEEFEQTQAFSDLYMELATDAEKAANFVNMLIPKDLADEVAKNKAIPAQIN